MRARNTTKAEPTESTRQRLLLTAERLIGQLGIEGASMRAVSLAAGQANFAAVQYHFNDKQGLIDAVMEMRLREQDGRRMERLLSAYAQGRAGELRELIDILYRPLAEIVDSRGHRSYARFLLQCVTHLERWGRIKYPLAEPLDPDCPTVKVFELIAGLLAPLSRRLLLARIDVFLRGFLSAVVHHENAMLRGAEAWPYEVMMTDLLDTISAGMAAPASPGVAEVAANQPSWHG